MLKEFSPPLTVVKIVTLVTRESNDFYSVQSELQYKVTKEDKDTSFSCEVSFLVPGNVETARSREVNITVHCKSDPHLVFHILYVLMLTREY